MKGQLKMHSREKLIDQFKAYLQRRYPQRRTAKDYISDVHQFATQCGKAWLEVTMYDIDQFVDNQRAKVEWLTLCFYQFSNLDLTG